MGKRGSHGSWSEVCRTALPGKLLEMQILRPHTRAAEWESGGGGGQHSVLTSPPWESDGHPNWRTKEREAFRGELAVLDRAPQPSLYACPSAFPNPGPTLCSCHLWGPFSCPLTHTLPSVHSHTQGQGHTHLSAFVLQYLAVPQWSSHTLCLPFISSATIAGASSLCQELSFPGDSEMRKTVCVLMGLTFRIAGVGSRHYI